MHQLMLLFTFVRLGAGQETLSMQPSNFTDLQTNKTILQPNSRSCVACKQTICYTDLTCRTNEACLDNVCVDPCIRRPNLCGTSAVCLTRNHLAICACPSGTYGDPFLGCFPQHRQTQSNVFEKKPTSCLNDVDCSPNEACRDRQCFDPCYQYLYSSSTGVLCGTNAVCVTRNHLPTCACLPGSYGNPFVECLTHQEKSQPVCSCNCPQPTKRKKIYRAHTAFKLNWLAAYTHCQSDGGTLATINSKEDITTIKNILLKTKVDWNVFWLGATNLVSRAKWVWVPTGERINPDLNDWEPGEPDNDGGNQRCLMYWDFNKGSEAFKWNDENCDKHFYYICEYFE